MPPGTRPADLPPALAAAAELTDGWAALPTTDLTTTLSMLVDWARAHGQSLDRLSVSQPDLEDAYLALTEPPTDEPTDSHASIPGGAHVQ